MPTAIGFDDDFIYRQIPLPRDQRTIKMTPLLHDAAQASFRAWAEIPNKIQY
jgi:hypothetical protein